MKKFKVSYTGFAYVEANSKEEAENRFDNDDCMYGKLDVESVEEVNGFLVEMCKT